MQTVFDMLAKTVTVNATLNWQETIRGVAAAIGEEAKAEEYIQQFQKKQSEVAATMEKSGAKGKTALFIMPWKKSFTYWSGSRMALYYEKLGFKPFEGMSNVGEITLEGIGKLDPEYIFVGKDYTNSSEITLQDLETNPVWNSLAAVKNKKMFVVDTEILGPLAMGQFKGLTYMQQLFAGSR
nr:ABC transporter substrate-binding protein [Paenibacillus konkukensis]